MAILQGSPLESLPWQEYPIGATGNSDVTRLGKVCRALFLNLEVSCHHQLGLGRNCSLLTSAQSYLFIRHPSRNSPLLRLVPASHTRPPSIHVPAIQFVVCPEFAAQSWLFIKKHEQMYGEGNRRHGSNRG